MKNIDNILDNIKDLKYLRYHVSDFELSIAERIRDLDYDNSNLNFYIAKFFSLITKDDALSDDDLNVYIGRICKKLSKGLPEEVFKFYLSIIMKFQTNIK
ncbi:hypothetical protein BAS09_08485 [Elizabethkingia ursingii]|uniref:hypothetical protein n=1 Tax=Elizabethkingia ursingii TaxID=1756150 RepID=UPI00099AFDE5|nr:hypothetical protein [Elizabethkingia ursingii]MCL1672097.1 hypothetical protein [Elizabethkingia ursingii]OPC03701.1 hypothetical protein BAS09_08485 [Elizabethkingia ursingii]